MSLHEEVNVTECLRRFLFEGLSWNRFAVTEGENLANAFRIRGAYQFWPPLFYLFKIFSLNSFFSVNN